MQTQPIPDRAIEVETSRIYSIRKSKMKFFCLITVLFISNCLPRPIFTYSLSFARDWNISTQSRNVSTTPKYNMNVLFLKPNYLSSKIRTSAQLVLPPMPESANNTSKFLQTKLPLRKMSKTFCKNLEILSHLILRPARICNSSRINARIDFPADISDVSRSASSSIDKSHASGTANHATDTQAENPIRRPDWESGELVKGIFEYAPTPAPEVSYVSTTTQPQTTQSSCCKMEHVDDEGDKSSVRITQENADEENKNAIKAQEWQQDGIIQNLAFQRATSDPESQPSTSQDADPSIFSTKNNSEAQDEVSANWERLPDRAILPNGRNSSRERAHPTIWDWDWGTWKWVFLLALLSLLAIMQYIQLLLACSKQRSRLLRVSLPEMPETQQAELLAHLRPGDAGPSIPSLAEGTQFTSVPDSLRTAPEPGIVAGGGGEARRHAAAPSNESDEELSIISSSAFFARGNRRSSEQEEGLQTTSFIP